jgi:hypothetical protein
MSNTFLEKKNVTGLKTLSDELEQEPGYYVKLLYKKSFTISNSLSPYLKLMFVGNLPLENFCFVYISISI